MTSLPPVPLSPALSLEECNKEWEGSNLSDRNVLITGGASGIGAAIAQTYAEKGAYVTIVDIDKDLGTQLANSLQSQGHHIQFVHTDITSWPALAHAFATAAQHHPTRPYLTTVIACAGVLGTPFIAPNEPPLISGTTTPPPPPDTSALTVNATALTYTAKLAHLHLEAAPPPPPTTTTTTTPPPPPPPDRSLILFSSLLAYTDFPNAAAYAASKHAARGLFRILRPLLAARGLRVNCVAPWLTRTRMTSGERGGGAPDLVGLFGAVGCPVAGVEGAVRAVGVVELGGRAAGGVGVNGRVLATGPDRIWDMQDDAEGMHGQKGLEYLLTEVNPGWPEQVRKMLQIMEEKGGGE